jgi:hypothetical protein
MKQAFHSLAILLAATCLAACQSVPQARVIRLMLETNAPKWRLSVDGAGQVVVSSTELRSKLTELRLRQGDLIIFGTPPTRKPGPAAATWAWLADYCESNSVAMYPYAADASPAAGELFSIPVYHWTAPFEAPSERAEASFFREGRFLGKAQKGFDHMLRDIARTKPKRILLLGSLYDINRSLGPNPIPYEHERDRLDDVLRRSGSDLIEMDILPGF